MPRINIPVADVWEDANASRLARQFLMGDEVEVLNVRRNLLNVRRSLDGYEGWLDKSALGGADRPTHWVRGFGTLAFAAPDIKSPSPMRLPFHAGVSGEPDGGYLHTKVGYLPLAHVTDSPVIAEDTVAVAERFMGVPYLWGGNTELGLDCSGLVYRSFAAVGLLVPEDSGPQYEAAERIEAPQRGDLAFWRGHVALFVDEDTLIHANAYHMCVALEPVTDAIRRIAINGESLLGFGRFNRPTE